MALSGIADRFTKEYCAALEITREEFLEHLVLDFVSEVHAWRIVFPSGPDRILRPFPVALHGKKLYNFLLADHISALSRIPREPASKTEGVKA